MGQVAVLFGGPAPEHDVSILTGLQASRELAAAGAVAPRDPLVEVGCVHERGAHPRGRRASSTARPRAPRPLQPRARPRGRLLRGGRLGRARAASSSTPSICCTHGGPGEDGTLQGALDLAGVAYAGPTAAGAALGMDKLAFAAVMAPHGAGRACPCRRSTSTTSVAASTPPYIVKPRFGGSSIGIDVVARPRHGAGAPAARTRTWRPARSSSRSARTSPTSRSPRGRYPSPAALGDRAAAAPRWRAARSSTTPTSTSRARGWRPPRELPASLAPARRDEVVEVAAQVAALCSVRGVARIDFLEGDGGLFVNEINTIPVRSSRHLFVDPVVPFLRLLDDLVAEARGAPSHRYLSAGADGTVLRSAGAIAAKLA